MATNRKVMGLALRFGIGATLLASSVLLSASAKATEPHSPLSASATPATGSGSAVNALDHGLRCTMSSGTSSTGREWGEVDISSQDPSICLRRRIGGEAPFDYPSCHERAYDDLGCTTVITVG